MLCELRSGSTLFRRLSHYFLEGDLKHVRHLQAGINNYFIHPDQFIHRDYTDKVSLLLKADPDLGIIFLSRRDKLAQALSIARIFAFKDRDKNAKDVIEAKKESKETAGDFHNFSEELLEDCILTAVWQYAYFKRFIQTLNRDVLHLVYEDDLQNLETWPYTIKKTLDFLEYGTHTIENIREKLEDIIINETERIPTKSSGHLTNEKYEEFLENFNKDKFP